MQVSSCSSWLLTVEAIPYPDSLAGETEASQRSRGGARERKKKQLSVRECPVETGRRKISDQFRCAFMRHVTDS
ncbi:hypothetical protein CSUI_004817 [Cystoisospora suis]|uniref:Uncharacterized protein n=1 Tax=Cystoisospora suis TaxID=483139 RepID=A0A2C6KXC9_9APIC|nr:hypothetical protein CSUI_004817 [Cystoisospora suis]